MSYQDAIERYNRIYRKADLASILEMWASNQRALHVYVHSPFCPSVCRFCYYKGIPFSFDTDSEVYEQYYSRYLPRSVEPFRPLLESRNVESYFFGGGTPSLMKPDTMRSVFKLFPGFEDVRSKTFEIHPAIWTEEQVDILAENNFTCCIIGIQSFDEELLRRQRRVPAPFSTIRQLVDRIRSRGMQVAVDLIYQMDEIDSDAVFATDLKLVEELGSDVISLQQNYDILRSQEYTKRFFELILNSELAKDYYWELADREKLSINRKKTLKCFRYVRKGIPKQKYLSEIFQFIPSMDEGSKTEAYGRSFPSVIGFGSYRNPRKNTFSIIRDPESTVEYIEINNNWNPEYYVTYESRSRDFFDECVNELNLLREIGPPPKGMKIVLQNEVPVTDENRVFRRASSKVDLSVSWDYLTPQIEAYVSELKKLFPHWKWWDNPS
jgi:hypothetical protein